MSLREELREILMQYSYTVRLHERTGLIKELNLDPELAQEALMYLPLSREGAIEAILSLPALVEMQRKADQWDALGYETAYVKPDRYDEMVADAERWRKVVEIAKYADIDGCKDCPVYNLCDKTVSLCGSANETVYAIMWEKTEENEGDPNER